MARWPRRGLLAHGRDALKSHEGRRDAQPAIVLASLLPLLWFAGPRVQVHYEGLHKDRPRVGERAPQSRVDALPRACACLDAARPATPRLLCESPVERSRIPLGTGLIAGKRGGASGTSRSTERKWRADRGGGRATPVIRGSGENGVREYSRTCAFTSTRTTRG